MTVSVRSTSDFPIILHRIPGGADRSLSEADGNCAIMLPISPLLLPVPLHPSSFPAPIACSATHTSPSKNGFTQRDRSVANWDEERCCSPLPSVPQ